MMRSESLALLACVCFLIASTHAGEQNDKLIATGGYAKSFTVSVVSTPSQWTNNRFGERVPILSEGADAGTSESTPKLHLKYLTLRGLWDLPALIMEEGGLPYVATYYSKEEFATKVKPTLEFGRLPVLEVEGATIAQSATIVRLLAQRANLTGHSVMEQARADSLFETFKELFVSHNVWGAFDAQALKEGLRKKEAVLHFKDTTNRGTYSAFQKAASALYTFESLLAASDTGFLQKGLSYVDLALWQKLYELSQDDMLGPGWADSLSLPRLGAFFESITSRPRVASFIHSDRRMPRIKRVDGDYKYVKDSLSSPFVPKLQGREL